MEEILEKLHTFFDVDKLIAFISGYLKKPVILESTECQLLAYNSYSILASGDKAGDQRSAVVHCVFRSVCMSSYMD
ncbi:hypothetical protein [Bacillus safensis FO-36b] [Bacillus safensis subsp. safensis]